MIKGIFKAYNTSNPRSPSTSQTNSRIKDYKYILGSSMISPMEDLMVY